MPLTVFSQVRTSIDGYVSDAKTGKILVSANIKLKGVQKGTTTDTAGYFRLTNLREGAYTVVISFVGYQHFEKRIKLKQNERLQFDIQLKPIGYRLGEVVVRSQQESSYSIGAAHIKTEFIKKMPTVFQADVFRSIQLRPGVKAASDFSSSLYIRGGSPDQTLILLDGAVIYNPSHFFGFFSTFNPGAVADIRLYKGAYPAKFGGRLGSVLSISNTTVKQDEFQASATFGLLASRASIGGRFKNGSWMLAGRRSTLEPLLSVLQKSTDSIPNSFYFRDINGKIIVHSNADNHFSLSFYSGMDDLQFPLAEKSDVSLNYGNRIFSGSWHHAFSKDIFSTFTLTGSHYFNAPSFKLASTRFKRFNDIFDFSFKGDVTYFPNADHKITTGFRLGSLILKLRDEFDRRQIFASTIRAKYASFYIQDQWSISGQWRITPGVRLNGFSKGHYLRVEPRFALEFLPTDHLHFQAAFGRYTQFMTLISNEAFTGFDMWLTAGEGVPPAYGNQYVFGIKSIFSEKYRLDLEVYYRSMKDLFEPDPFLPDRAGIPYQELFYFGEGYAYGAKLLFKYHIEKLSGFAGYTFSITRRKFPHINTPLAENGSARFFTPNYNRRHSLSAVISYELNPHWSLSAVFNYATGQAYTKPLGRTTIFELPTSATDHHLLISGRVNASRLPAYHRLDLAISRKGSFFGLGETEWKFEVINVYSRRNIWFYDYDLSKNPAGRKPIQLLPLLPSISYSLHF
ncbi:MAG TPA: TonB-dependent receptor [Balneolaceae bacterium]